MLKIKKRYIVNERNEPVEVVLDLRTFRRIQAILEDHLLGSILEDAAGDQQLPLDVVKRKYERLKKRS
jgi:hypothetical protein